MSLINKVDTIHLKNIKYANIVCVLIERKFGYYFRVATNFDPKENTMTYHQQ